MNDHVYGLWIPGMDTEADDVEGLGFRGLGFRVSLPGFPSSPFIVGYPLSYY